LFTRLFKKKRTANNPLGIGKGRDDLKPLKRERHNKDVVNIDYLLMTIFYDSLQVQGTCSEFKCNLIRRDNQFKYRKEAYSDRLHQTLILLSYTSGPLLRPVINDTAKRTKKIMNKILAIPASSPAIPPNPRTPATIATIKKVKAQFNITTPRFLCLRKGK